MCQDAKLLKFHVNPIKGGITVNSKTGVTLAESSICVYQIMQHNSDITFTALIHSDLPVWKCYVHEFLLKVQKAVKPMTSGQLWLSILN